MIAALHTRASIETRTWVGRTPLREALTTQSGESWLTRTVVGRLRPFEATSVVQARTGVARIDAILTI